MAADQLMLDLDAVLAKSGRLVHAEPSVFGLCDFCKTR
jgi:hypothetical protein